MQGRRGVDPGPSFIQALISLSQVYRRDFEDSDLEQAPTTPGMKYRHYSPDALVILIDPACWRSVSSSGGGPAESLAEAVQRQARAEVEALLLEPGGGRVALLRTTAPPGTPSGLVAVASGELLAAGMVTGSVQSLDLDPLDLAPPRVIGYVLGCLGDTGSVARALFAALRLADELGVAAVVGEGVGEEDEGMAVMNRLRKAASRVVQLKTF